MALTKIITDSIDLSLDTTGLKMPKGTTAQRPAAVDSTIGETRENTTTGNMEIYTGAKGWRALQQTGQDVGVVPTNNFNTVLYTGTGSGLSENGVGFAPDFVWLKNRDSGSTNHHLFDSVRGVGKTLYSDGDFAEATNPIDGYLSAFDSDGFTLSAGTRNANDVSNSGDKYVAWSWKAGGAATTISGVGTINSDVSANTAAGFSIVKYTGDGSAGTTIAHGLGGSPEIVFSKSLDSSYDWNVFSSSLSTNYMMKLNTDGAAFDGSAGTNGGAYTVSATLLTVVGGGSTQNNNNASGDDFIAYCWRSIPGYSKIGFYVGNGSTTGPEIYTGFKPAWLLRKNVTNSTDAHWSILDNKRNITTPMNPRFERLLANLDNAENTSDVNHKCDFNSTGFQPLSNHNVTNALGETYIYMAFSE
mgnify:CR=1 FL=1